MSGIRVLEISPGKRGLSGATYLVDSETDPRRVATIPWEEIIRQRPLLAVVTVLNLKIDTTNWCSRFLNCLTLHDCDLSFGADALHNLAAGTLKIHGCRGVLSLNLNGCKAYMIEVDSCGFDTIGPLDKCNSLTRLMLCYMPNLKRLPVLPLRKQLYLSVRRSPICVVDDSVFSVAFLREIDLSGCPMLELDRQCRKPLHQHRKGPIILYGRVLRAMLALIASQRRRRLWLPRELWHYLHEGFIVPWYY